MPIASLESLMGRKAILPFLQVRAWGRAKVPPKQTTERVSHLAGRTG